MILVTGGLGFVGRRLVDTLASQGRAVRVLTRTPARASDLPGGVDVARGDLLDSATLVRALSHISTVVHLAGVLPDAARSTAEIYRTNVEGTRNLARAVRACGVAALVYGSSTGVYGDGTTNAPHHEDDPTAARSTYEQSKLEAERTLKAELMDSNVRWLVLRLAGIYGPGRAATLAFYRDVQRKLLWVHGPARVVVQPAYVDDVVHAILLALDREDLTGETFNIAGERALSYPDLITAAAQALGRRVVQLVPPSGVAHAMSTLVPLASMVFGREPSGRFGRLALPIVNRAVDISKARQVLGFEPVPLEHGIKATVEWYRREGLL